MNNNLFTDAEAQFKAHKFTVNKGPNGEWEDVVSRYFQKRELRAVMYKGDGRIKLISLTKNGIIEWELEVNEGIPAILATRIIAAAILEFNKAAK